MNLIRTKLHLQIPMVLAVGALLAAAERASAAPSTWSSATGGNWSVAGNWSPSGAPGTTSDVTFGNTAGGIFTTNDITGETVNSLIFDWNNQAQQTMVISPGKTLTVNSAVAAGSALLLEGSATTAPGSGTLAPAAITGAGGNLVLNGLGDIVVHIGNSTAGAHMATLDLSGLDSLNATVGRLLVGQANAGAAVNRPSGTLILARTNTITCSGASPQVMLQDSGSNANGGTASVLTFGQVNSLFGDTMRLGGQKGNANMGFGSFSSPSLKIRNADGVSPCTVIDFGYNSAASTGNSTVATADFSAGTVDMLATTIHIAQGAIGSSGACTGTLTLGAGTANIGDFEIGYGNATAASGATGATTGTVNVNNNGLFPAGALVQVPTKLGLARTNGGSGVVTGILNVNGGTVQASTIVSEGGVSTINLNSASPSSTLIVSNTAGSLTFPIGTFSMADSVLQMPALNGSATMAVKTLTIGGSANTINIGSIPPIGSYPADFTLINYQTGYTAGTGPLSLGTLPSASPAYAGSLVDTGGGVIKLHLTSGPVTVLGMHWTGAINSEWDLSTYNWTFQGFATNYFDGSSPLFDDSSTQTNVDLPLSLSPGTITVSNSAEAYTISGVGNISGAGSLTKKGTSTLIVANQGEDNIGTVVISAGTLQIGTNDLNGNISAINITNNGSLVVNRNGTLNMNSAISGTGSLTKSGNGTLVLSGASTYTGATTLSSGTLEVDGSLSGTATLTTSANTVLSGSGTVSGPVTVGGLLNPGTPASPGAITVNGNLTLNAGSTLNFDLSAANPGGLANDSVSVTGNLHLNNNTITVNFDGTPQGSASYVLFTYTGTLSGSFNPVVVGTHFTTTVDTTSTPGTVYLDITSGTGFNLDWASASDPTWDLITTNWLNLGSGLPSTFAAGDTVLLDDSNGVVTTINIPAGVNVSPAMITDSATNNSFTIGGSGHITGSGGIVLSGPSTLAINTANSFSGAVDIQAGVLQTGNATALGSSAAGTTVENGATLDLNGQNLGGEAITISGAGFSGEGALINNGAAQAQAVRQVIMAGDATFGGSGMWQINNGGGAASLSTGGNPFNLTKVGPNQVDLAQLTTVDTALANIDIQSGELEFSGLTPSMGDPTFTNTVEFGGTLSFANAAVAWNKQFVFNGDGSTTTVNVGTSGNPELDGPVEIHGVCVFNVGGLALTITNTISGDGGVIKNGGSPLIFSGPTTYTGNTTLNAAALRLVAPADLSGSTNITINAGSTLTVTGMVNSTFILLNGHNLSGNGVVNGKLTANAGSTIAPGVGGVGMLTVSNAVVLGGTNIMELDQDNATNDILKSGGTITYGGTLSLVNIDSPLTNGVTFKLFSASSYSGSFATITPPTPGAGQTWDISALGTSGTIKVVTAAPLGFASTKLSGTNVIFSGSGGTALGTYYVLTSTNLATPVASWIPIATNTFDSSGNFAFTNGVKLTTPQRFYRIQTP
jgi:fibronectin-binding autotransporter adhesin